MPANILHGWKNLTPHLCPEGSSTAANSLAEAIAAAREGPGFQDLTEEEVLELQATNTSDATADIMDAVAMDNSLLEECQ